MNLRALILGPLLGLSVSGAAIASGPADVELTPEEAGAVFKQMCVDAEPPFDGFERTMAVNGFTLDEEGYYRDSLRDVSFIRWEGEGRVFCTMFYGQTEPDLYGTALDASYAALVGRVTFGEIIQSFDGERLLIPVDQDGPPGGPMFEHIFINDRGDKVFFRMSIVVFQ